MRAFYCDNRQARGLRHTTAQLTSAAASSAQVVSGLLANEGRGRRPLLTWTGIPVYERF